MFLLSSDSVSNGALGLHAAVHSILEKRRIANGLLITWACLNWEANVLYQRSQDTQRDR